MRTLRTVLGAEEHPEGPPADEDAVLVVRRGRKTAVPAGTLVLESGSEVRVDGALPRDVPLGYHRLRPEDGPERRLILAPARCHLPPGRRWGWSAQLYAARSRESWGIGDLADLRRIGAWTARLGGSLVLVNPLHAPAPVHPQNPSPYFPASRRFLSPLYLRIEEIPGARNADVPLERLANAGRALNEQRVLDRDAVWRLKREALEAIWDATVARGVDTAFEAWVGERGDALRTFATWAAIVERHGASWRAWPAGLRHPGNEAVRRFADGARERVRFWCWVQWHCQRQLEDAIRPALVLQDLPIGFDPDGLDAWAFQDVLAHGVSVGAPPDAFNTRGQDWGLPPFVPWRLRAAGYGPFVDTIRASMVANGGLRIDHVMGLQRLWWIPAGAPPTEGAYVRSPEDDLLAIVALESVRARAVVVGEDLGTVDPAFRKKLARNRMLSYRLLWFEEEDPSRWPEASLAAVTTHDLPTVAGLWSGADLEEQERLGMAPNVESTQAIRERLAREGGLGEHAPDGDAVLAAHRLLARAPSRLVLATLEDAVAERARPNLPGADDRRPNWSIALPAPLEELEREPRAEEIARLLGRAIPASTERHASDEAAADST